MVHFLIIFLVHFLITIYTLEKARERLQAAASYSYDWDAVGNVLPVDCIDYLEGLRYKNTGFYEVIVQID